jgi:hypothetical protein
MPVRKIKLFSLQQIGMQEMAVFIDVPRLNFAMVFPYTRQAAASYSRPSCDSGERVLRVPIGEGAHSWFVRGCGRHLHPFSIS